MMENDTTTEATAHTQSLRGKTADARNAVDDDVSHQSGSTSTPVTDKNVLVTGGAGFIGSNLAARLAAENDVTILDNFSTGSRSNVDSIDTERVVDGDITDADLVKAVTQDQDIVVHMAAMMGVRRTLENPLDVLQINIEGTRNVLQAAAEADVDRVLFGSTSEVYGDLVTPPYTETDDLSPKTNYAVAKVADERYTRALCEKSEMDYTIVRYFNVYGPRQDGSAYGYVVPRFVKRAKAEEPLTVHGDGEQTRDFTYIDDAIDGTVTALNAEGANEIYNIGGGTEVTIRQLAETVVDVVGSGTVTHVENPRPYRVERRCAEISKARNHLDYRPTTGISEGVERLMEEM